MKLNSNIDAVKAEALKKVNEASAENKGDAILEAIETIVTAKNEAIVQRITEEAARAATDAEYAKKLGLRTLNTEETKFYESFKNLRQSITASQIDIIPSTIIDNTLADLKTTSKLFDLITFAPADVKQWIVAAKTGVAAWGGLTDALTSELSATITNVRMDIFKLHALLLIPKPIRDLSLPFVDRYFQAILREAMVDGVAAGYLYGDGTTGPIGIFKTVAAGHAARVLSTLITGFTPKLLAPVKKHLSANGKRTFSKIYLVCNPADEADYVDPALYDAQGNMVSSYKNLEVISDSNVNQGDAAFVVKGYTMGFSGFQINEYKETKAIDDVDVVIAKVTGNGRPIDDYVAYPFDVEKLVEFIPLVKNQPVV